MDGNSRILSPPGQPKSPTVDVNITEHPVVIARPAHVQLTMSAYRDFITSPRFNHTRNAASLYLEYFPLFALGKTVTHSVESIVTSPRADEATKKSKRSSSHGAKKKKEGKKKRKEAKGKKGGQKKNGKKDSKSKKGPTSSKTVPQTAYRTTHVASSLQDEIPSIPWAQWLSPLYQLIWLGGGEAPEKSVEVLGEKHDHGGVLKRRRGTLVGCLHFDRNENIMVMVAGTKNFTVFDPTQSPMLYGDHPVHQGSLGVSWDATSGNISFARSTSIGEPFKFTQNLNNVHAYSPVDIRRPDYSNFPRLRDSVPMHCVINKVNLQLFCCWIERSVSFVATLVYAG